VGWTNARLDELRLIGDPDADEVVTDLFARHDVDAVNALMVHLRSNEDPAASGLPPELIAFLASSAALPPWACMARLERAQELFQTFGIPITLCLFCASLPSAYAAANGVKVLYRTARLETDTRRRIMETGQFLMDVLAPGSFQEPAGVAVRSIQRVRMMHAGIRALIHQSGEWDMAWGEPLNQEDLAGTLMSFAFVVGEPLPRLGIELTADESGDYIHTWNVIGSMLGIRDELLPKDIAEARELVATIRARQFAASTEGAVMTAALVNFLEHSTPTFGRLRIVPAMIRHLIGNPAADLVQVPAETPEAWRLAGPFRAIAGWLATRIARERVLRRVAEPVGREILWGVFNHERGGERAPFAIPDHLARTWDLPALPDVRLKP
jgi:hypothetical protein